MVGMCEFGQEPTGGFVFVGTVVGEHLGADIRGAAVELWDGGGAGAQP